MDYVIREMRNEEFGLLGDFFVRGNLYSRRN